MPVPVPVVSKPSAHPVVKSTLEVQGDRHASAADFVRNDAFKYVIKDVYLQSDCANIYESFSLWPTNPVTCPSEVSNNYATAYQQERRALGNLVLLNGLTVAESAAGVKQRRAEACHSPVHTSSTASAYPRMGLQNIEERRRSSEVSRWYNGHSMASREAPFGNAQFPYLSESAMQGNMHPGRQNGLGIPALDDSTYGVQSNGTPFAEFVDRAVGGQFDPGYQKVIPPIGTPRRQHHFTTEPLTDAEYIKTYRDMSEPLSEWIADYVWKVCTQGLSLPPHYVSAEITKLYPEKAPASLASSVRSVLCSTLLQPSVIVLALWYIARLPVFFDWQTHDITMSLSEQDFREELLRVDTIAAFSDERNTVEFQAPFRLIVLGCMLANKWLDDHTFSNKTWHSVSEIPIRSVNRLELLALGLFTQDLSVPPQAWDQWLTHLRQYQSKSSPYPAPIRRPSSADSSALVRKFIEDLSVLHSELGIGNGLYPPRPIFSPLLTYDTDTLAKIDVTPTDKFEIDLDEDGPLREEYVPKRHVCQRSVDLRNPNDVRPSMPAMSLLPPPSEWSPQADPPVDERRGRRDVYIPVQPCFGSTGYFSHTRSFSAESNIGNTVWGPVKVRESRELFGSIPYQPFVFPTAHSVVRPISYSRTSASPPSAIPDCFGNTRQRSTFYADEAYTTSMTCGQHIGYRPAFAPHAHTDSASFHLPSVWLRT